MNGDLSADVIPGIEPHPDYSGRTILLGVTGGIAAYKSASLASAWTQRGATVRVIMTPAAQRFVTPLTFRSVTRQPVATDIWRAEEESHYRPEHIDVGDEAALFVVAPATADFIGRIAHGLGDDILTVTLLAYLGPLLVCPAMNDRMWAHPAVQENIATLRRRGVDFVEPGVGHLACGSVGAGRLASLQAIDAEVTARLESRA